MAAPLILNTAASLAIFSALRARQHLHRIGSTARLLSSQMSETKRPTEEEHSSFCEVLYWLAGVIETEAEEADNALKQWDAEQEQRAAAAAPVDETAA